MTSLQDGRAVFRVSEADEGQRLDRFLRKVLPEVPLSHIFQLLRKGRVRIGGTKVKGERRILAGDDVTLEVAQSELQLAPKSKPGSSLRDKVSVIYEDEDLLVLDKPAGMAVHPGTGTPAGSTLIERVWRDLGETGGVFQPQLAHRLDRGTSGVVLVAKNRRTLLSIQRQIAQHTTEKIYLALVQGKPEKSTGIITSRLERIDSRDHGAKSIVTKSEDGQTAETRYKIARKYPAHTLLEVQILSGRLHQIRAHLSSIGLPIVGDDRYGATEKVSLKRPFLHASRIGVEHLGRAVYFDAPLPPELEAVLTSLVAKKN